MALLFGSESWVMLDTIMRVTRSTHVGFLHHIMEKRVRRQANGLWETPVDKEVMRTAGMHSTATCIGQQQVPVAQWVTLQLLLEVCNQETGYKWGRRKRRPLWRQETTEDELWSTLEDVGQGRISRNP